MYKNTWHITENNNTLCGHKGLVSRESDEWEDEEMIDWLTYNTHKSDCEECCKIAKLICRL